MVEPLGIEPRPSALQTDVRTSYTRVPFCLMVRRWGIEPPVKPPVNFTTTVLQTADRKSPQFWSRQPDLNRATSRLKVGRPWPLDHGGLFLAPAVGYDPTSLVFQTSTFTRLASQGCYVVGRCGYAPLPVKDEFYRLVARTTSFTFPYFGSPTETRTLIWRLSVACTNHLCYRTKTIVWWTGKDSNLRRAFASWLKVKRHRPLGHRSTIQ